MPLNHFEQNVIFTFILYF